MDTNVGEGTAVMTLEQRKREIPLLATRMVLGATGGDNWCGKKDACRMFFDNRDWPVHIDDYKLAKQIAEQALQMTTLTGRTNCMLNPPGVLEYIEFCQKQYDKTVDFRAGKRGLIMLSDNDGCGFWRMRLPAKHMEADGWYADITSAPVAYEQLLEYDTIFVQRFHEWSAYYVLERLKKAGKRIIYDIDDDLFSIPKDNPAANVIRKDQQFAALETMKLADVVTVSTDVLKERLEQEMALQSKIVVIQNALDLEGWNPTPMCGSPDGLKRIFWQGGSTHAEDWVVCIGAVERIMKEQEEVILMILGFLPPVVLDMVQRNSLQSRVQYMGFSEPETYYQMVKHVRADVGLAPLVDNRFNAAKSELKFIENTVIGMPTVASNVAPYYTIEDGKSGMLARDEGQWYYALKALLVDAPHIRRSMLMEARKKVTELFDIRKVAAQWASVLCA
jgi:glycosyltransferase involved in cell wall biosynthesis